jgi:colicin import membrane protein
MIVRKDKNDAGIGITCFLSAIVHLAAFLLLIAWGYLFPSEVKVQETYYVDVVNLPVASPRSGNPTQKGNDIEAPPPPPVRDSGMSAPPTSKPAPSAKNAKVKPKPDADADNFEKRMAKLQGKAESNQQNATIERLQRKLAAGKGRSGMPRGTGSEAGSRYEDYLKSRLEDALKRTISYTSKSPEVVVRLTVASDGQISRRKIERSSGDRAFERAVMQAIDIVNDERRAPPNRKSFEGGFVFRPQGISNKNAR